jgi:hypothetical protein
VRVRQLADEPEARQPPAGESCRRYGKRDRRREVYKINLYNFSVGLITILRPSRRRSRRYSRFPAPTTRTTRFFSLACESGSSQLSGKGYKGRLRNEIGSSHALPRRQAVRRRYRSKRSRFAPDSLSSAVHVVIWYGGGMASRRAGLTLRVRNAPSAIPPLPPGRGACY